MADPDVIVDFGFWAKEKRPMLAHDRLKETEKGKTGVAGGALPERQLVWVGPFLR